MGYREDYTREGQRYIECFSERPPDEEVAIDARESNLKIRDQPKEEWRKFVQMIAKMRLKTICRKD